MPPDPHRSHLPLQHPLLQHPPVQLLPLQHQPPPFQQTSCHNQFCP
jgi:hypothetical protein